MNILFEFIVFGQRKNHKNNKKMLQVFCHENSKGIKNNFTDLHTSLNSQWYEAI